MDKKTKVIVYAVAAVILILLLVVCAAKIKASKPATALNNLVKELNNGNFKKAGEYCADNTMDLFGVDENIEDLEMVKLYYKNIDIKVNKVTKSKDTAVINVEISNKDLGKILNNYMNKAKELALENLALLEFLGVVSVFSELSVVSLTVLLVESVALVALGLLLVEKAILKDLSLMAQAN